MSTAEAAGPGSRAPAAEPLPEPPAVLIRPGRVTGLLAGIPSTPVTVLVSPAGHGKTALVAAWAREVVGRGGDVCWLGPADHLALPAVLEPRAVDVRRSELSVVVVDDAHRLPVRTRRQVTARLAEDPLSVRLVLLSREDLPWLPPRLTLTGGLRVGHAADLRLDDGQTAALVRAHHPAATDEDVEVVVRLTRGWPATVVLAAHALQGADDPRAARESLLAARTPMTDFLVHEVFNGLEPALRHVLVTTAEESPVTAQAALALSGDAEAPELLAHAAEHGLLVTRYDAPAGATRTWRYHPLLLEVLRRRTGPGGPEADELREGHARAAERYAVDGRPERAVRHAALSGDADLAVRTIVAVAPGLLMGGHGAVLAEALLAVPADVRDADAGLLALEAIALRARADEEGAKRVADRALALPGPATSGAVRCAGGAREVSADLASLDLWQARNGWRDPQAATTRAAEVLGCRPASESRHYHDLTGLSSVRAHWLMLDLAALQIWTGDLEEAALHLGAVASSSDAARLPRLRAAVLSLQAFRELLAGAYQTALDTAERCLRLCDEIGNSSASFTRAMLTSGWARFHETRFADAELALALVRSTGAAPLDPLQAAYATLLEAHLLTARGEVADAQRLLALPVEVPGEAPAYLVRHAAVARLVTAAYAGDVEAIWVEVRVLERYGELETATYAAGLATGLGGEEEQAVAMLEGLLARHGLRGSTSATAAVIRTALLDRIGTPRHREAARAALPDTLSRVAGQRLLWHLCLGLVVSPTFLSLVAAEAAREDGAHPFAADAWDALRAHADTFGGSVTANPPRGVRARFTPEGAELLTARELDVLQQLALGASNADIAGALYLSENTVKTHLAAVYRKLGVDRRSAALRVARDLGLV